MKIAEQQFNALKNIKKLFKYLCIHISFKNYDLAALMMGYRY